MLRWQRRNRWLGSSPQQLLPKLLEAKVHVKVAIKLLIYEVDSGPSSRQQSTDQLTSPAGPKGDRVP